MGFLTTPSSSTKKSKLSRILLKGNRLICLILYIAGFAWFVMLGHKDFNNSTYFSENALLPGLVYSEIKSETISYALKLHDELEHERENHKSTIPYAWIQSKMKQIGLETYTHNFTLNYPLGGGKQFTGKNIYGILRAPRIGSTESFVISAPYRPADSIHAEITDSIPILLAFAEHARKQKYWAKDIIFLVTDQEQLGIQAWLHAYHTGGNNNNNGQYQDDLDAVLRSGTLDARAGSIQAAINLELQGFDTDFIDVKIEGLNGQLPNLDLVNLVQRISLKEGISCGHRQTSQARRSGSKSRHWDNFQHMFGMMLTQASGVPNGNHGLFHRYGIEAVTMEAHRKPQTNYQRKQYGCTALLKLVEGVSRSVNNLLERFHQSFFFYLLVANDRFVSIGDYMPALALMVAALLVRALIIWLSIDDNVDNDEEEDTATVPVKQKLIINNTDKHEEPAENEDENDEELQQQQQIQNRRFRDIDLNFIGVGKLLITFHIIGFLASYLPLWQPLSHWAHLNGLKTEQFLIGLFGGISFGSIAIPFFIQLQHLSIFIIHIAALLEMATALLIIAMLNFSLAFFISTLIVPIVILLPITKTGKRNNNGRGGFLSATLSKLFCFMLNPLIVIFIIVFGYTHYSFPEMSLLDAGKRAMLATMEAITFSVVDSIIYGNWIFDVIAVIFLPIWICLWTVLLCKKTK